MADTPLGSGGRSRRRSTSPAPVSDLLQQLRALGLNQGRGTKTYAGLAAAGRSGSGATDLGRGGGSYRSSRPGPSSAFFKGTGDVGGKDQRQGGASVVVGSATPPTRPAARVSTPGTAASQFAEDDDILFQMSGLKPLRTASRVGARGHGDKQQQQPAADMHRTSSAPALRPDAAAGAAAARRPTPLSRAFSAAAEASPAAQAGPQLTQMGSRGSEAAVDMADELAARSLRRRQQQREWSSRDHSFVSQAVEAALGGTGAASRDGTLEAGAAAAKAAAGADPCCGAADATASPEGAAVAAEEAPAEPSAPGWSEEILNWMLSEKAGLLVEAQRAARRQAELEGELERLRARSGSAEREVQRLMAERRSLLDRVQQLSASEADACARLERLTMENDALAAELADSQEACREMLAARRAARDALSEVSAQNARLLGAYVEKKEEAAALQEALRRQQRAAEARIQALEAQLAAGCSPRTSMRPSPPPSPGQVHLASPDAASPAPSGRSVEAQDLLFDEEGELPAYCTGGSGPAESTAATPEPAAAGAASPPPGDKENVNPARNAGRHAGRRAAKEQWDDERAELLSLLERLQHQLSAHAEQQTTGATPRRHGGTPHSSTPAPSPFAQPLDAGAGEAAEQSPASPRCNSNLGASFDSVSGGGSSSGPSAEPSSSDGAAEVGSPAVATHHVADSPQPLRSATRSDAPSPPSVCQPQRQQAAGEGQQRRCSTASEAIPIVQQAQQRSQQQRASSSVRGSSQTLEAFLSPPGFGGKPAPVSTPSGAVNGQAESEKQRLLQAEERAAQLEAEVERLRLANAAAEQRAQLEERRQAADGAKVAGNVAFQAQRFEEAAQHYSRGLEALGGEQARAAAPSLAAVLHCNRAAAHQACGRYLEALADCFRAAELDASYTRVYHRRADAYWALRAYDAAAQDLAHLARLGAGPEVASRLADAQRRAAAAQPVDHYAVLGVKAAATPGEVKAAYRQLALAFHPDKAAAAGLGPDAANAIFKLAAEAYRVLGDAEARRQHDIAALRHKYRRYYAL